MTRVKRRTWAILVLLLVGGAAQLCASHRCLPELDCTHNYGINPEADEWDAVFDFFEHDALPAHHNDTHLEEADAGLRLENRLAAHLEMEALRQALEVLPVHLRLLANNQIAEDDWGRYIETANALGFDFAWLHRGARYGQFNTVLVNAINDRWFAINQLGIHVSEEEQAMNPGAYVRALEGLIARTESDLRNNESSEISLEFLIGTLIDRQSLLFLYRLLCIQPGVGLALQSESLMRAALTRRAAFQTIVRVLSLLQYPIETRIYHWVNGYLLQAAQNWIESELRALRENARADLAEQATRFRGLGMPRDVDVYDYNAHFERIERSFQNYADGLRRDANVPQWAAFNVTLEEFFANESVVMTVLERWYARYAASNAELAGVIVNGAGTQIYVKRLFVQSLLYMFCARWGRADSAERYRMGAFQDLIRSLGIFRDRNVRVDVGMLPSGTYRMAGGGILTVSIIGSSLNGTQNVQRQ